MLCPFALRKTLSTHCFILLQPRKNPNMTEKLLNRTYSISWEDVWEVTQNNYFHDIKAAVVILV